MKVEGEITVAAPRARVFERLSDAEFFASCIDGVSELTQNGGDRYSATYGSLGAVIILLLWFYWTGAAVLMGGEINSVLEHAAAEAGEPSAKLEGEKAPGYSDPALGPSR